MFRIFECTVARTGVAALSATHRGLAAVAVVVVLQVQSAETEIQRPVEGFRGRVEAFWILLRSDSIRKDSFRRGVPVCAEAQVLVELASAEVEELCSPLSLLLCQLI